ncbi:O-antigen ligase family protein [Peredibacter starrii]|uniref:O-antigen ligase family protein n=1 Tax=Peredibacter starrii TaxID=28202 RepID=A0AAX4HRC3_9BACT|nr:O-antigen ligase family protein [Peredibacter starrii]WPU65849.1 O-antigen ligase family protein [Peredibacter starrii]
MNKLTSASFFFLAAGILTSVSILSAYQVLFVIPLCYYSYWAIKNNDYKLPKSAWFLLAFAFVAFISLVINFDVVPKPGKNFGRIKYFLFGVGGIYVLRVWVKETTDKIKTFLTSTFLVSMIVAGLYAAWEFFISGEARVSSLTETMRYGYGSAMMLLMLLGSLLHHDKTKNWLNFKLGAVAFLIGFMGMYLTYTRGALLGFLCGLPFLLYFYKPKLGLTLGGLAVLGVLGLGGMYLFGSGKYESRFLVNKNNSSDVIRRSQWQSAIIAIQEKPVLGWGLSNFHSQLKRIKNQYNLDAKSYDDAHSHNLFLEITSGTGFIGLFFFLGWLISWAIHAFKTGGLNRALIVPMGVAFVVSSQFEVTFDANNASMIFFVYAISTMSKKYVQQS